jgi:hypothetical protein
MKSEDTAVVGKLVLTLYFVVLHDLVNLLLRQGPSRHLVIVAEDLQTLKTVTTYFVIYGFHN